MRCCLTKHRAGAQRGSLGISIGTLRDWEQGRRAPEGPANVLLRVAAGRPEAVWDVVRPAGQQKNG